MNSENEGKSKLQASLKTYERRNKKKRPPNYYNQPDTHGHSGMNHNTIAQPMVVQQTFSMPPPGLHPIHYPPMPLHPPLHMGHVGMPGSAPTNVLYATFTPSHYTGTSTPVGNVGANYGHMPVHDSDGQNSDHALMEVVVEQNAIPTNSVYIPPRAETYQNQDHERTSNRVSYGDSESNVNNELSVDKSTHVNGGATNSAVNVSIKNTMVHETSSLTNAESTYANVSYQPTTSFNTTEVEPSNDLPEVNACKVTENEQATDFNKNNDSKKAESTQPVVGPPKPKSWAGLFKSPASQGSSVVNNLGIDTSEDISVSTESESSISKLLEFPPVTVPAAEDSVAKDLGEKLSKMTISHSTIALQPRGLVNRGNWCYINGTLQALIACPPFYNLLRKLPRYPALSRGPSSTPILDALVEFVHEFQPMARSTVERGQTKGTKDITPGPPFEPSYVYKILPLIGVNSQFKCGKQEDAEEFLSFILDGMHEEMSAAVHLTADTQHNGTDETEETQSNGFIDVGGEDHVEDDDWEQVGPKKKSITTRRANFFKSPIANIFAGMLRSAVFKASAKETATLQPFFTLQLDIQSETVRSVQDALDQLVSKEQISGFTCPTTNSEVEVSKKLSLEELPPVLILHLKCFVYNKDGGSQKLMKKIDYKVELEIAKDLLSPNARNKLGPQQRSYKLFAVVYHHGKNSTGGHYTTSVFHPGINGWVNSDDSTVKTVPLTSVLRSIPPRVPYLLYYRRLDSH